MSRRQHQFPAMSDERVAEIDALLEKQAAAEVNTKVPDELLAEVKRLHTMNAVEKPVAIKYNLRFGGAVGTDGTNGCFVCRSADSGYQKNISGFVEEKSLGFHAVEWFGGHGARLDHRSWEPKWLQLKVGTCEKHVPCLEKLAQLIQENQNLLTPGFIETARAIAKEETP